MQKKFLKCFFAVSLALVFMPFIAFGQDAPGASVKEGANSQEPEVLETQIGLDQMVEEKGQTASTSGGAAKKVLEERKVNLSPEEQQLLMINESLKNVMEENQKLTQEKESVAGQLRELRGETEVRGTRINALTRQRDELQARAQKQEEERKALEAKAEEYKSLMAQKEKEFNEKMSELEQKQAQEADEEKKVMDSILPTLGGEDKEKMARQQDLKSQAKASLDNLQQNIQKASLEIGKLSRENKKLKTDAAKLHYNMANLFFEQGKYDLAAKEYKKIIDVMPNDPSVHYNLAFVSGEFLNDKKTALEHYRQYLYLNPNAEDTALVKEKMLEAQLDLEMKISSPLEKEVNEGKEYVPSGK